MLRSFVDDLGEYDAWWATITHTHTRRIRIRVMDLDHEPLGELTPIFATGDVTIDTTRIPSRVCTLKLLDPSRSIHWEPDEASSYPVHMRRMIRVEYLVQVPSLGEWVSCPVFTGVVVDFDRDGAMVSLVAEGKDSLAMGNLGHHFHRKSKAKVTDVIKALLIEAGESPGRMEIPDLKRTLPTRLTLSRMDKPWVHARKLARSLDRELFYDGRGRAVMRKAPQSPIQPAFDQTVLASEVRIDRDRNIKHNRWIVLGKNPRGPKKRITVDIDLPVKHALSARNPKNKRNGKPHWVIDQLEDSQIKNKKRALEIAESRRDKALRATASVTFETLPIPNVEEHDLVRVKEASVGAINVRCNQVTIPLGVDGSPTQSFGLLKVITLRGKGGHRGGTRSHE